MNNDPKLMAKRHTLAHLLAAAILEHYPETKPTIGPAIDNGFYYDFEFPIDKKPTDKDLKMIEKTMRKTLSHWHSIIGKEVKAEEARGIFKDNKYKLELIEEIVAKKEPVTLYTAGEHSNNQEPITNNQSPTLVFTDLCRGGHSENPRDEIAPDSFKLSHIAGAYWRGDEKNTMLTRIYGLAFNSGKELEEYELAQEEAKKRDHRKLGKELDLFTFSEHIGSGLPLYTPKGALIRRLLNEYTESLQTKADYTQVWTPQIAKAELFKISGHYDKYKEDMFRVISNYSEEEFYLKPMNCPQHTQIYASKARSYRDLPLRYTDFAMLYRDERPGELNGLARVRSFSQDDCHIFCREDQVDEEIDKALSMTKEILSTFDLKYKYRLSTRDPANLGKYLGDPKTWDRVEKWAERIMQRNNIEYFPGPGEAAFYAPKMDLIATDALGRQWQLSTVQIDFVMPERFDLTYTDKDGLQKRPVMIHRAIIGSPERFMMILLEHYAGNFPFWLAPVQVKVIPVGDEHEEVAKKVHEALRAKMIRSEMDNSGGGFGKKVRAAKTNKIPYFIIIGDKDIAVNKVTLESRDEGQVGQKSIEEILGMFEEKNLKRK